MTVDTQHTDRDMTPLQLSVLPKAKVWGGRKLNRILGDAIPVDGRIGEAWVVWDQLTVARGPLSGRRLADLVRDHPRSLLGTRLAERQPPAFPLLVKFLDTEETLSVQVHPDDGYAVRNEGQPNGKAEMWLILEADPGAKLIHGVSSPLTRPQAEAAITAGTLQDSLEYVDVTPGDVFLNSPGTIHALGGGILLYELQQSSDLTYRLYDWDRNDPSRPLHLGKALDVACLEPLTVHKIKPIELVEAGARRQILCACDAFAVELLWLSSPRVERVPGESFQVLTVLQGSGSLRYEADPAMAISLAPGATVLVPAALREYEISPTGAALVVIKGYVPDLVTDVVLPLRARGFSAASILALGGDPAYSDLSRVIDQPVGRPRNGQQAAI